MSDEAVVLGGEFWVADNPDLQVRGEFSVEQGKKPEVRLEGGVVDDPRVRPTVGGVAFTRSPDDSVKAHLPIDSWAARYG